MQLKTEQNNNKWRLYFNDPWSEPVGYRAERAEPLPNSFNPTGYDTREEAERAREDMESYIMKHHQETKRKKKR